MDLDREPSIVDCSALARRGLWSTVRCCLVCHSGAPHDDALELDLGGGGEPGAVRLHLCCNASARADLAQFGSPQARTAPCSSSTSRMAFEAAAASSA